MIQLYHGNGKGKTTAAAGCVIRAAGYGKRVIFAQFMKGRETGELNILNALPDVTVLRSEKSFGFYKNMTDEDKLSITSVHNEIINTVLKEIKKQPPFMAVLDEITAPLNYGLIDTEAVKETIRLSKVLPFELILTGRNPSDMLISSADYISEIKAVRHPYENGITAREGIEF